MQSAAVYIETDPDAGADHERFFLHTLRHTYQNVFPLHLT